MITPDGRYVVYFSNANDIVANDTQGEDVFVWDRTTGEARLLSRDETGAQTNGDNKSPSISADGKYVVFYSTATDLNSADTSNNLDVYRVSLNKAPTLTGDLALTVAKGAKTILTTTELGYTDPDDVSTVIKYAVSNLAAGSVLVDNVAAASFTHADLVGGKVAFQHDGSNTAGSFDVAVDDGNEDASTPTASLFNVRLSTAGLETELVSLNAAGTAASGNSQLWSEGPRSLSTDGRYVVFTSSATDLVNGDTNGKRDVFLRDMVDGTTTLVSVGTGVNDGDSDSARVSDDGKFVLFESDATNLVAGDTNGENDLFVRDLVAGTTTRVSVDNNNQEAALGGWSGVMSADGTKVAFRTYSSLVANDSNNGADIYVRDLQLGTTALVSVGTDGNATGLNNQPTMSSNGRYIAFSSYATNYVAAGGDTNNWYDVYLRDTQNNTTTRVSINGSGQQSNGHSSASAVSNDGKYVVFESDATNLASWPTDNNGKTDIYLKYVDSGGMTLVSRSTSGGAGNGASSLVSLSDDGRFVVFTSDASNLVAGDTNGKSDVFVWDRDTGVTRRVGESTESSIRPSISGDGKYVTFQTTASLTAPDGNGSADIYRVAINQAPTLYGDLLSTVAKGGKNALTTYDLYYSDSDDVSAAIKYTVSTLVAGSVLVDNVVATSFTHADLAAGKVAFQHDGSNTAGSFQVAVEDGNQDLSTPTASLFNVALSTAGPETELVSVNPAGTAANGYSELTYNASRSLSTDGRYVMFQSSATDLVSGDTNGREDVFLRDMVTGTTTLVSVGTGVNDGNSSSGRVSGDGKRVLFRSDATNLVAGDTNGTTDLFVRDLAAGTTTRVSVGNGNVQAAHGSWDGVISADGKKVAFSADNSLAANDGNNGSDIYVRDLQLGTTTLVSVGTDGNATGDAHYPNMSANGRFVTLTSNAATHVATADTNAWAYDLYLRDTQLGTTKLVSTNASGQQANNGSYASAVSNDGQYVVFESNATNLVTGVTDNNSSNDIFLKNMVSGVVTLVSKNINNAVGNGDCLLAGMSDDGRFVAYWSNVSDLVTGDTNDWGDVFVWDRDTGETRRIGESIEGSDYTLSISGDGKYVTFQTSASLTANDSNGNVTDVYRVSLNRAPTVIGDFAGEVTEGGAYQLTSADLSFTDVDDMPEHITYKVINMAAGKVRVDGVEASSFTAAQVAAGLVTFRHDGASTPTTAYFSVSGDDGNQDKSAATNQIFRFTVSPVNDPLQDFKFSTSHGGASALAVTIPKQHDGHVGYLSASDEDGTPITYGVADPRFKIVNGNELHLASMAFQDGEVASVALTATSGAETLNLTVAVTVGNVGEVTTTAYGDDNDYITLSTSMEGVVRMGGGRDVVIGASGADVIDGEANEDNLYGGAGADTLYGGASEDIVVGDAGNDQLYGGDGGDVLSELWDEANSGDDLLDGGNGIDIMYAANGNDVVYGGTDDANNWAHLGAGDDTYHGAAGTDTVYGLEGADTINGNAGHDTLLGFAGNDRLYGGAGIDYLVGYEGNDTLEGGADNDGIVGEEGDDTLVGDGGIDILYGGEGNDTLRGGADTDGIFGDEGTDTFQVGGSGYGADYIYDFETGAIRDKLVLQAGHFADVAAVRAAAVFDGQHTTITVPDSGGATVVLRNLNIATINDTDIQVNGVF